MKPWPNIAPNYEDIIDPLLPAIQWAINCDFGMVMDNFEYDGYDTPSSAHACASPDEVLTAEYVNQSERTAIEAVLNVAFRLGYEQGVREKERMIESKQRQIDWLTNMLNSESV